MGTVIEMFMVSLSYIGSSWRPEREMSDARGIVIKLSVEIVVVAVVVMALLRKDGMGEARLKTGTSGKVFLLVALLVDVVGIWRGGMLGLVVEGAAIYVLMVMADTVRLKKGGIDMSLPNMDGLSGILMQVLVVKALRALFGKVMCGGDVQGMPFVLGTSILHSLVPAILIVGIYRWKRRLRDSSHGNLAAALLTALLVKWLGSIAAESCQAVHAWDTPGAILLIPMYCVMVFVLSLLNYCLTLTAGAAKRRQKEANRRLLSGRMSWEEFFSCIYNKELGIPQDAAERSDYIAWLMRQGFYEEADRVSYL